MPSSVVDSSFDDFMRAFTPTTPLSSVAQAYWQDYREGRPIDGGVAFETMLRTIPLDGSLASLTVLDSFLTQAKPHLALDDVTLMQRGDQRNLLLFIGFYAGFVLAYQAQGLASAHHLPPVFEWVSHAQLCDTFAPLARLIDDDFSYSMAISLLPVSQTEQDFMPPVVSGSVFFPLVSIIEQLYPRRQPTLTPTAPHFGFISASVATSVGEMLSRWQVLDPNPANPLAVLASEALPTTLPDPAFPAMQTDLPVVSDIDNPLIDRKSEDERAWRNELATQPVITYQAYARPDFHDTSMTLSDEGVAPATELAETHETLHTHETNQPNEIDPIPDAAATMSNANPTVSNTKTGRQTLDQKRVNSKKLNSRQAITKARAQAKALEQQQREEQARLAAEAEAQRQAEIAAALANPRINEKLLNQRKSMIDQQPVVKDSFSELETDLQTLQLPDNLAESTKTVYQQAVTVLQQPSNKAPLDKAVSVVQKLAEANVSDAMLQLALWQLRGRADLGIDKNPDMGIEWVKKAAQLQDSRAEKLLSKLYFSGEIVGLDTALGKFWLAQASAHGHAEAQRLQQSFALVNTLTETRHEEDDYLKKLAIGTGVLVIIALIIIVAVKL